MKYMEDASDHAIIERVLSGDVEQYARLVERHYCAERCIMCDIE